MRVVLTGLAALLLITAGCARVHRIDPTSRSIEDLNASAKNRRVTIKLTDGRTRVGDRLIARSDTVSWYDIDRITGRYAVPTSQVHKVSVKVRGRGMGRGALWGLAAGGVVGGAVFAGLTADTEFGPMFGLLLGGGLSAAIGAGIGAAVGFFMGDKEEYIFEGTQESPANESVAPPGSSGG